MKLSETLAATARKGKGYIGDEEEGAKNETRPEEQRNSDAIKETGAYVSRYIHILGNCRRTNPSAKRHSQNLSRNLGLPTITPFIIPLT